ncbi:trypsin-like serine protease [Photobacterium leiognathi]|uniref:trypsin-like serine protease n=1 Tax=Photobacterium leiognathi TaxID=553611 RepID=UPI002980A482|nr:trypsin-like serine protease [Photobacterium leiognathi]
MISFVKSSVSMLLFAFSAFSYAESPPPINGTEINHQYNVNVESYNPNTLTTTSCQGTLVSPSWVLTGLKCIKNANLSETHVVSIHDHESLAIHQVKKAYKFKKKKFALLQLDQPITTSSAITLLREPLLPRHGRFAAEVVQGLGYSTAFSIKGKNKKTARHNTRPVEFEKNFKGGAWVLKTHNLGDVQIGLTHNRYQAIQTASIAKKIDRIISQNSGETVNWIDRQTLLDTLACEADGTCIEPPTVVINPECPEGVMDCGDVCDWNDCTEPPTVVNPECPEGVMDCGDPCDWAIDCTEPPVVTPECPEGVLDCGDVCDWNDCSVPEVITVEPTANRAPYIIHNDVMTINNRPLMS